MQKHFSVIGIFLFLMFFTSCGRTVETSTVIKTVIPASKTPLPSQTWTPTQLKIPTDTPTLNALTATEQVWEATFSAGFATSKANSAATHIAAYATLESRNAVCSEGYGFDPLFPEDVVKGLDVFQTDTDKWTVIVCLPVNDYNKPGYTQVINHNGSIVWTISYDIFKLPEPYQFLGASGVDKRYNYLYLRPSVTNWGGGGWNSQEFFGNGRYWGDTIYRIKLDTGELTTVLPEIENGYYFESSISPYSRYLAYSNSEQANWVYIENLFDNQIIKIIELDKDYSITGDFTWTPDGKTLIFAAGVDGWEQGKAGISIFRLDMNALQLKTLLLNDLRNLIPWWNSDSNELWQSDSILNLGSIKINEKDFLSNEWAINIENGQLIQVAISTSTP